MRTRATAILFLASLATPLVEAETKVIPLVRVEALGGQYFFRGDHVSFDTNTSWFLAPVIKLSERTTLLPSYSGLFSRVRSIEEIAGGAFLTQERQDHVVTVKGIRKFGNRTFGRAYVGYTKELLQETVDEKLGGGLFDYDRLTVGFEGERRGDRLNSVRGGLDLYAVRYPNYRALSNQGFGGELNTGDRVLDYNAMDGTVGTQLLLTPKTTLGLSGLISPRFFTDQNVVQEDGTYRTKDRLDVYTNADVGVTQALPEVHRGVRLETHLGLTLGYSRLDSDQNNYDTNQTRFNPNYYDYADYRVSPGLRFQLAGKVGISTAYTFTRRNYNNRPVQDAEGNYLFDVIHQTTHTFSYGLTIPLTPTVKFQARGAMTNTTSNMEYEQTYRYNYTAADYFVGLAFEL